MTGQLVRTGPLVVVGAVGHPVRPSVSELRERQLDALGSQLFVPTDRCGARYISGITRDPPHLGLLTPAERLRRTTAWLEYAVGENWVCT